MSTVEQEVQALVRGDKLTRDEFLRRWKTARRIKHAELIGGVVYMPSPVSLQHGDMENRLAFWLAYYALSTPGCAAGNNATWLMGEDAPQPDIHLRILPDHGGQSGTDGDYAEGAPEFLAEVCVSSTAYDLHQKFDLYQSAGVQEYVAVLMREQEVRRHRLTDAVLQVIPADPDGVLRSSVFPGLWLDPTALLAGDMARVLAVLTQGLNSSEHAEFVTRLAKGRP